jgi:hypothetical protein
MFSRLVVIVMLVLFPLQWTVAQTHEAGDDAENIALSISARTAYSADVARSLEPGGVCQFDNLAHTTGVCVGEHPGACSSPVPHLAAGSPAKGMRLRSMANDIDRPNWSHHGFSVVDL